MFRKSNPIFVDTSVLIDGRILPLARSGFMTSTLTVPRTVVQELQLLADQADPEKRSRARYGLDVLRDLQHVRFIKVVILQDSTHVPEGVDNRLLALAKKAHGSIMTIDFNLNKVAQIERIPILNINDLARDLRMAYLPGERIKLDITTKGNDSHQGVGHLSDGTMVVVEQAVKLVGKTVEVEFIRSLQTAAGRMMFAKLVQNNHPSNHSNNDKPHKKPIKQMKQSAPEPAKPSPKPVGKSKARNFKHPAKHGEDSLIELVNKQ